MKLKVDSSPHIRKTQTTARLMKDVAVALLPALASGIYVHGWRAFGVTAVSVLSCAAAEICCLTFKRSRENADSVLKGGLKKSIGDGSFAVTGMLFAMTMPVTVPYGLAALGGVFAIVVVKELCGGLGQNVLNPALAARALLTLLYPAQLTSYPPLKEALLFGAQTQIISSATPLHFMQIPTLPPLPLWRMALGLCGGSIGETSALALLLGFGYLLAKKVITPHITLSYVGSFAAFALIFSKTDQPLLWMAYEVLGGGLLLGAVFMATDYATSPVTPWGRLCYGTGCGALTLLFRYYGLFPEGVSYAIVLMNALAWRIDKLAAPTVFGHKKRMFLFSKAEMKRKKTVCLGLGKEAAIAAVFAAGLFLLQFTTQNLLAERKSREEQMIRGTLISGGEKFVLKEYQGQDERIRAVYQGRGGYVVETVTEGYAGRIVLWVGLDERGTVKGLRVKEMRETPGLGLQAARNQEFLAQFIETSGEAALGVNIDGISAATVTSRAVQRGVNAAVAFVTGADVMTAPTKWGG